MTNIRMISTIVGVNENDILYIKERLNIIAVKVMYYEYRNLCTQIKYIRADNKQEEKATLNKFYLTIDDAMNNKLAPVRTIDWFDIAQMFMDNGYDIINPGEYKIVLYGEQALNGELKKYNIPLDNYEFIKYQWTSADVISTISYSFNMPSYMWHIKPKFYKSEEEWKEENPYKVYTF